MAANPALAEAIDRTATRRGMSALSVMRMSLGEWAFEQMVQAKAMEARHIRSLEGAPLGEKGIDPIAFITMLQHRTYVES